MVDFPTEQQPFEFFFERVSAACGCGDSRLYRRCGPRLSDCRMVVTVVVIVVTAVFDPVPHLSSSTEIVEYGTVEQAVTVTVVEEGRVEEGRREWSR